MAWREVSNGCKWWLVRPTFLAILRDINVSSSVKYVTWRTRLEAKSIQWNCFIVWTVFRAQSASEMKVILLHLAVDYTLEILAVMMAVFHFH